MLIKNAYAQNFPFIILLQQKISKKIYVVQNFKTCDSTFQQGGGVVIGSTYPIFCADLAQFFEMSFMIFPCTISYAIALTVQSVNSNSLYIRALKLILQRSTVCTHSNKPILVKLTESDYFAGTYSRF